MAPSNITPPVTDADVAFADSMWLTPSFIETRARNTDGATSREAAKHAATQKAAAERRLIAAAIAHAPMTAREVAAWTGLDYIETQRRISECGLTKTTERRGGCAVWSAA